MSAAAETLQSLAGARLIVIVTVDVPFEQRLTPLDMERLRNATPQLDVTALHPEVA